MGYIGAEPTIATAGYSDWVLLQSVEASHDSSVGFTGINSDFDEYKFVVNIHPETDNVVLKWQCNAAGQTGFNETITSSALRTYHQEDGSGGAVDDRDGENQHQGTSGEYMADGQGGDADQRVASVLTLYAPSSTMFVKQFDVRTSVAMASDGIKDEIHGGYINTTSAIDEVHFFFSSGYVGAGNVAMYGLGK